MSSPYPVLNNKPIDQWKVTELKEELRRRKLPIKGLKDDLIRRLDEALRIEAAPTEEEEEEEMDNGVNLNSDPQDYVEKEEAQLVVKDHTEVVPDKVVEIDGGAKTDGTVESTSEVKEEIKFEDANTVPPTEPDATAEITSEVKEEIKFEDANMVPPTEPDLAAKSTSEVKEEIKFEDANMVSPTEPDATAESTPEVKEIKFEDPNLAPATEPAIESSSDVKGEIKFEDSYTRPYTEPDASVAEKAVEEMEVESNILQETTTNSATDNYDSAGQGSNFDDEREHTDPANEDSKPIATEPNNQVSEVSPDLGSIVKCESISTESMSITEKNNNLKGNLNADNFDLELDVVKPEMVQQPSSSIPPPLDGDLHPKDGGDDKEPVKEQASLEEIDYKCTATTNVESSKKDDSADGGSPEKLNLDRSSSEESMEEDVTENKNVIESNIKCMEEKREKHDVKDEVLPDAGISRPSSVKNDVVEERKPRVEASIEKRKLEEGAGTNETVKRQRRWNSDNVKVSEGKAPNLSVSNALDEASIPTIKRTFTRSDSAISEDSPKERIVPPSLKPPTTSLRIDRFVRPFTLRAVQELLAKTGSVCSFWMDHIKTHCYVTYSSAEEAIATRNAVYNLQWPPNGGNHLIAEFVDPQDVKLRVEAPPQSPAPITPTQTTPRAAPFQQAQASNQTFPSRNTPRQQQQQQQLPPPPIPAPPPLSDPPFPRERLPPPPPMKKPEPPVLTLDDLFKKTKAAPRIYYLPLSEEQVAAKLAAQGRGAKE
uniref:SAP domain-containing protein n=1 Tax=Ananas comosus var. bracteatus TaxID=296719 RepID=A0A6V7QRY9_ANACO